MSNLRGKCLSDKDNKLQETPPKLCQVVKKLNVKDASVCKFCHAFFSRKSNCKRHESNCRLNDEKQPKFSCLKCKKEFLRKDHMSIHVKRCYTPNAVSFNCKFCNSKFTAKRNCVVHEKKCDANAEKCQPMFQCDHCKSVFHNKSNLSRHLNKCSAEKPILIRKTPCLGKDCSESFYHKKNLIQHFSLAHQNEIDIKPPVVKTFSSIEEFNKWKEQEEENTFSFFSARRGQASRATQHFYCQHDGSAKLHSKRKTNKRRNLPRIKAGHYCIAKIKMTVTDNKTIHAEYYPTHSHSCEQKDQRYHPIPATMSTFIDEKLSENIPPHVVYNLAKEHFLPANNSEVLNSRASNLTLGLVLSRGRRRRIAQRLDEDDARSVYMLAAQHIENDNSILIYKPLGVNVVHGPEGINSLPNVESLFMFGFQTESQLALMKRHSAKILIVNETNNTNYYKYQLFTAMIVDENLRGWPVAHLITSNSDADTLQFFFQALRTQLQHENEVPTLKCVITDDNPALINAMTAGFSQILTHLLCKWSTMKNLKENLKSKVSKNLFDDMWSEMKEIINAKEESLFLKLKNDFQNKYDCYPDAAQFMSYLHEHYWGRAEKWSMCYRNFPHGNIDTTGPLQSFHNRLKLNFLNRKPSKRLDDLINLLYDIAWYDDQTRYKETKEGFVVQTQKIFERHQMGLQLEDDVILEQTPESGLWEIKAGTGKSTFFISRNVDYCELDLCVTKCTEEECCSLCAHLFCCSCPDYHPLCKHIHKLQSVLSRNMPRIIIEENFYNFEPTQNVEIFKEQSIDSDEILEEPLTIHERKRILCQKLQGLFAIFQKFMSQDLSNVSEDRLIQIEAVMSSLEPCLISEESHVSNTGVFYNLE